MPTKQDATPARSRRRLTGILVACAAAVFLVAPGIAGAGSGETSTGASGQENMVAEAMRMDQKAVQLWNERKWDEFAATYAEDAIACPPNHEPIRGGKSIAEYYKGLRDVLGELEGGTETLRATASGKVVSLLSKYSAYSGRVRVTAHELYERQSDGSLKLAVDMFAFRDPKM
jgi:ketosteroid isomerase-like protein